MAVIEHLPAMLMPRTAAFDKTGLRYPQEHQYRARPDSSPAIRERIRVKSSENVLGPLGRVIA